MKTLKEELKYIHRDLCHISDHLYKHPELGDQEYQSMQLLMNLLKEHQFEIEAGVAGRKTAFKAVFDSGKRPAPLLHI